MILSNQSLLQFLKLAFELINIDLWILCTLNNHLQEDYAYHPKVRFQNVFTRLDI